MFTKSKLAIIVFIGVFFLSSCEQFNLEPETQVNNQALPTNMELELPSAISSGEILKSFKTLSGKAIHNYLRNFIHIGSETIEIVNSSFQRILAIDPEGVSEFSYTGLDGKTKYVSIKDSIVLNDTLWDYQLEIYDNSFSNIALQAFWNEEEEEQLIIFNPNLLNHYTMEDHPEAMIRIEYNLDSNMIYERSIFVGISNLTISEQNPYHPNNIKLFFGVNNQIINFIGSSNNPNVILYNTDLKGKNWSFRGKADLSKNLAVVELALPETELDSANNIMVDFSLRAVILEELRSEYDYGALSDEEILTERNIEVTHIESPSLFNSDGFQSSGRSVPSEYAHLSDLSALSPFIPLEVKEYELEFINLIE